MTLAILLSAVIGQAAGPARVEIAASVQAPPSGTPSESGQRGQPSTSNGTATKAPPPPGLVVRPNLEVLTFEEAIREAHEKNLDLQAAQARLDQAQEISRKAWAGYLPSLVASGAYTRNQVEQTITLPNRYFIRTLDPADVGDQNGPPGPNVPPFSPANPPGVPSNDIVFPGSYETFTVQPLNQFNGQVQLNQALMVPTLWSAISTAYTAEKVAKLTVENARREIMFAVAQLYYGALGLKQTLQVQQRLLEANLAHERDAKTRVNAGASPKIALIRAQIDRARSEQDVRRAELAFASAKIALATMLQRQGDFDVAQPQPPEVKVDQKALEDTALNDRPDVLAAQSSVELAKRQHTGIWLSYLPSIVGSAAYRYANFTGFTTQNFTWVATISASWTLWDGGLRESQLRETDAKLVEARATARSTELKAIDDVRRAILDLESARANAQKAEEQLSLARENMRLTEVNFDAGVATQLDVTDATTALGQAELGAVAERLNAQLAVISLLKAAGQYNP
jgi:outer membrane protein TolC